MGITVNTRMISSQRCSICRELNQNAQGSSSCAITTTELLDILDGENQSLIVVISHNPHELRGYARRLGDQLYERRRRTGLIDPLVSFIFDEADEFIPQQATLKLRRV